MGWGSSSILLFLQQKEEEMTQAKPKPNQSDSSNEAHATEPRSTMSLSGSVPWTFPPRSTSRATCAISGGRTTSRKQSKAPSPRSCSFSSFMEHRAKATLRQIERSDLEAFIEHEQRPGHVRHDREDQDGLHHRFSPLPHGAGRPLALRS